MDYFKHDLVAIKNNLAFFPEIDRELATDVRLDLPDAPMGRVHVLDEHPGFQNCVEIRHLHSFLRGGFQ